MKTKECIVTHSRAGQKGVFDQWIIGSTEKEITDWVKDKEHVLNLFYEVIITKCKEQWWKTKLSRIQAFNLFATVCDSFHVRVITTQTEL